MKKNIMWIYLTGIVLFLSECAPGPPPPPPIFHGFEWLIIGFMIWIGIFFWKKYTTAEPLKIHYLTELLNTIHQRLKSLEEKIEKLEEKEEKLKHSD